MITEKAHKSWGKLQNNKSRTSTASHSPKLLWTTPGTGVSLHVHAFVRCQGARNSDSKPAENEHNDSIVEMHFHTKSAANKRNHVSFMFLRSHLQRFKAIEKWGAEGTTRVAREVTKWRLLWSAFLGGKLPQKHKNWILTILEYSPPSRMLGVALLGIPSLVIAAIFRETVNCTVTNSTSALLQGPGKMRVYLKNLELPWNFVKFWENYMKPVKIVQAWLFTSCLTYKIPEIGWKGSFSCEILKKINLYSRKDNFFNKLLNL